MKCHYEVLGVERTAADADLKKAYKKLALRWHPDKNLDSPDEAKEQFQLVQQAYEVLSDPRERAWYDDHREAILRGAADKEYEDDAIDLFQYFTSACFKGYGDDEKGFYTVYRKVFETLAAEDAEFALDEDLEEEVPGFGDSKSSYEEVVHNFYAYWQSYRTKRSYAWLDPYEFRDASNRRVLRIIEKENKKIRDKAKRERNEQVRNLVAFVYRRDKRVQAHAIRLEERAKQNLKKTEERRKQQLLERQRQLKEHKESEWSKFSNMEAELKNIEANLAQEFGEESLSDKDSDNENAADNALYCVACNKLFKTQKAFANHENSKKHKENVSSMKATLLKEDEDFEDESEDEEYESEPSEVNNENLATDSQMPDFLLNPEPSTTIASDDSGDDSEDELMSDDEGSEDTKSAGPKKGLPEGVNLATGPQMDDAIYVPPATDDNKYETSEEELVSDQEDESSEDHRVLRKKKKLKRGASSRGGRETLASSTSRTKQSSSQSLTDEKLPGKRHKKPRRRKGNAPSKYENNTETSDKGENDAEDAIDDLESDKDPEANTANNQAPVDKRKERQKKRKEAKVQKQMDKGNKSKTKTATDVSDLVNRCFTCNKEFSTRNKLFEHLKRAGHGLLIHEMNKLKGQEGKDKSQKKQKGPSI